MHKKKYWMPPYHHLPSGFFDGAAIDNKGGAVIFLLISDSHHFHIKMGCGSSTKTRAELLDLWALLYFAKKIGIQRIHIFGDSMVVINWEK